jgi:hypothetical protein
LAVAEPAADEVVELLELELDMVGAALEDEAAAPDVVLGVAVEPHAARPIGSAARRATKAVVRRAFMSESCFPRKGSSWWVVVEGSCGSCDCRCCLTGGVRLR